ncbi:hypothetical protein DYB32_003777 [Aphanomyces invadans]|nr:hypothetical protein DYB32_003777 [Aphanomyces invadans]
MFESNRQIPDAADLEREATLQLSVDIDTQLNMMSTALKETIERLNQTSLAANGGDDNDDLHQPIAQILKVLNVHHNSLLWIDENASKLTHDMGEIAQKISRP